MYKISVEAKESTYRMEFNDNLFSNVPSENNYSLSQETKTFLTLPSESRDDSIIPKVLAELDSFKFFRKLELSTRQTLLKKLMFGSFKGNDYLLRQGEEVPCLYVLLNGVVGLRYNVLSPGYNSGGETQWPERLLQCGDYFGHSDLIRHRPSTIDAYSVSYSEVLMITFEDFHIVKRELKSDHRRLRDYLYATEVMRNFKWSDEELMALEMFSKLINYEKKEEICDGLGGKEQKWSYFMVAGECTLTRQVTVSPIDLGSSEIQLKPPQENQRGVKFDLEFMNLEQGFFFGVGEDLGPIRVLANPGLECLLVMKLVLNAKSQKVLQSMADSVMPYLPSEKVLLYNLSNMVSASEELKARMKEIFK